MFERHNARPIASADCDLYRTESESESDSESNNFKLLNSTSITDWQEAAKQLTQYLILTFPENIIKNPRGREQEDVVEKFTKYHNDQLSEKTQSAQEGQTNYKILRNLALKCSFKALCLYALDVNESKSMTLSKFDRKLAVPERVNQRSNLPSILNGSYKGLLHAGHITGLAKILKEHKIELEESCANNPALDLAYTIFVDCLTSLDNPKTAKSYDFKENVKPGNNDNSSKKRKRKKKINTDNNNNNNNQVSHPKLKPLAFSFFNSNNDSHSSSSLNTNRLNPIINSNQQPSSEQQPIAGKDSNTSAQSEANVAAGNILKFP
ncbi:MAG: hypothetical protein H0W64_11665 [Gammaproteobacteria bacterium]|nr:hypothetical protein [Gammaproteobacteria bacterium]